MWCPSISMMYYFFRYYGLWLWFPELFNKLDVYYKDNPNATVSVCEVTDYKPENVDNIVDCSVGNEVFLNSFLISIAALPGNVWTMVHMDKLGRKFFVVISMVLSGGCVFFIYLVRRFYFTYIYQSYWLSFENELKNFYLEIKQNRGVPFHFQADSHP